MVSLNACLQECTCRDTTYLEEFLPTTALVAVRFMRDETCAVLWRNKQKKQLVMNTITLNLVSLFEIICSRSTSLFQKRRPPTYPKIMSRITTLSRKVFKVRNRAKALVENLRKVLAIMFLRALILKIHKEAC